MCWSCGERAYILAGDVAFLYLAYFPILIEIKASVFDNHNKNKWIVYFCNYITRAAKRLFMYYFTGQTI